MRCAAARKQISEYPEDGLSQTRKAKLKSHLETCRDCQGLLHDFEKIEQEAKNLPSLSPSPSAWQRLLAGLKEASKTGGPLPLEEHKGWFSLAWMPAGLRYALAAVLALIIIGGGVILGLRAKRGAGGEGYTLAKLKEAQHYYVLAIEALDEAIGAQKNGLDPQLAGVFKRNLEAINGTIQACERIVEKDPNNLMTRAYLLTVYREKVTFLEEMMGAKKSALEKRAGATL